MFYDIMLAKFFQFVKKYQEDIILVIGVILISLLSFAVGYIVAKQEGKESIKIEYESSNYWRGDLRTLSGKETC